MPPAAPTAAPLVRLRVATPADAPAIASTKAAAARRAYAPLAPAADLAAWLARRADPAVIAGRVRDTVPPGAYLLAYRDGPGGPRVLGAGQVRPEPLPDGRTGGYLADVYVDPPGRGAGTALVRALLAAADAAGWPQVRCFALAGNTAAVDFFARFGFACAGSQPNAELPGRLLELRRPRPGPPGAR